MEDGKGNKQDSEVLKGCNFTCESKMPRLKVDTHFQFEVNLLFQIPLSVANKRKLGETFSEGEAENAGAEANGAPKAKRSSVSGVCGCKNGCKTKRCSCVKSGKPTVPIRLNRSFSRGHVQGKCNTTTIFSSMSVLTKIQWFCEFRGNKDPCYLKNCTKWGLFSLQLTIIM